MTSINLPDSLESIGPDSFHGCSGLKTITIPDSVTNIGNGAFDGCSNIEFKVGAGNKAYTSIDGSLYTKDMKQLIANGSEHASLPGTVVSINKNAFTDNRRLKSINLPNYTDSIGKIHFTNCKMLTTVCLPNGLTEIADDCFRNRGFGNSRSIHPFFQSSFRCI